MKLHIVGSWAGAVVGYSAWLVRLAVAVFTLHYTGLGVAMLVCVVLSVAAAAGMFWLAARSTIHPAAAIAGYAWIAALIIGIAVSMLWCSNAATVVGLTGHAMAVVIMIPVGIAAFLQLQLRKIRSPMLDPKAYAEMLGYGAWSI